jgi:hypothetical protein
MSLRTLGCGGCRWLSSHGSVSKCPVPAVAARAGRAGGLAGGAAGVLMFTRTTGCDCTPGQVAFMFVGPFIGGGIGVGALIDAVTVSRHTVYRADGNRRADLRIAPVMGPARRAVRLSIGF